MVFDIFRSKCCRKTKKSIFENVMYVRASCTNKINLDNFFFHTMFAYYARTTGSETREEIYRVIQHQMHIIYLCPALNIHIRAIQLRQVYVYASHMPLESTSQNHLCSRYQKKYAETVTNPLKPRSQGWKQTTEPCRLYNIKKEDKIPYLFLIIVRGFPFGAGSTIRSSG